MYKNLTTHAAAFFALRFFSAFWMTQQQLLQVNATKLSIDDQTDKTVTLPYALKTPGSQYLHLKATLTHHFFSTARLRIIPDDCITSLQINGKPIDVSRLSGRCDWAHGTEIDLAPYVENGNNTLQVDIHKKDGIGGINLFAVPNLYDPYHILFQFFAMLGLAGWIVFVAKKWLPLSLSILLAASAVLQLHYLSYTDYSTRTFDLLITTGHLDYIKMIADHLHLPNPTEGWEYHQPPLYYLAAAAVYALFSYLPVLDPLIALQLFSLFLFTVFLYYALRILSLLISDKKILLASSILLLFWPSGIIHSVRIGNDILFFTLFSLGLFSILQWQLKGAKLWLPLLLASLALITKANGIILFGIVGILILMQLYRTKDTKTFLKQTAIALLFFIIAFAVNFADNIYYAFINNTSDWLVSNVINTINSRLYVANDAYHYLYFDLRTYLKEPFINPWDDRYGRQFFWNYLLKSSLFSEFFFQAKSSVATIMGALSLLIFSYISFGLATVRKNKENLVMGLAIFLSVAALLIYRIKIPVACNTDFRYIYPVIIPMAYFYGQAMYFLQRHNLPLLYYGGYTIAILFSFGSVVMFY